jgi:hypothetical protein
MYERNASRGGVEAFPAMRELNRVVDQPSELFRLIRFADADDIIATGLGPSSDGIAAARAPRLGCPTSSVSRATSD